MLTSAICLGTQEYIGQNYTRPRSVLQELELSFIMQISNFKGIDNIKSVTYLVGVKDFAEILTEIHYVDRSEKGSKALITKLFSNQRFIFFHNHIKFSIYLLALKGLMYLRFGANIFFL